MFAMKKNPLMVKYIVFSIVIYLLIFVAGILIFLFSLEHILLIYVAIAFIVFNILIAKVLIKPLYSTMVSLETESKAKSEFLARMSHEIRTPMNAILGITEIQLQKNALDPDIKEALSKISAFGYSLLGIINDILDLSKIEAGKMELTLVEYETASLINDSMQLNMIHIGDKPVDVKLRVDESVPSMLLGDKLRIKQILSNLLSNAFKYTDKGSVVLEVNADKDTSETLNLIFTIRDTGQGMSKEQMARLFEEYSRFNLKTNYTVEGTGLGMSIAKSLIENMGGKIFVESEPGAGTTFVVHIPQKTISGGNVIDKEVAQNQPQIVQEFMPYGNVLVVDDVEMNLYVATELLLPYGLKTDTALSGSEAIKNIKSGNIYDIIFMDHIMPEMDGIEATQIIRDLGYSKPIVALTANAGQAEMLVSRGFDAFISKPIDIRQLNAVLNKFIHDRQAPEFVQSVPIDSSLLSIFVRDAKKSIAVLQSMLANGAEYEGKNLQMLIVNTHAMKSALTNIGEKELSKFANELEQAVRERNFSAVTDKIPEFLEALSKLIEKTSLSSTNQGK